MPTTYLITGANRGLGRGLVEAYLSQPDNVVIAAVRNPGDSTSKSLHDLPKEKSSSLIVVKIESTSETDASDAVSELQSKHNVEALDVVIANAGIAKGFPRVEEARTADLIEHFQVNAVSVVILFRAVLSLLKKSKKGGKFIAMSTAAGSIEYQEQAPIPNAIYGTSKAALNWLVKKIHLENEDLVAFAIHPGWVQTEMGNAGARFLGMEKALITIEQSVPDMVKVIDNSTRESSSGKFIVHDGTFWAW